MQGNESEATIAKSSISEMRSKIGYVPLQNLVARARLPFADAKRHHRYQSGRLLGSRGIAVR